MGSPFFTERPARKTRRRFSCCTAFPLHRGCSSRSSPGFPIAITLSRPITRASDTATGRTRRHSRIRSITTPRSCSTSPRRSGSRATRCTCRITAAPWVFAWPWPIRTGSRRSSSRTPWRTTKAWGRIGSRGGPFGPIARPSKAPFAAISCRGPRRGRAMSATIRALERYDPDLWTDECAFLNQPGQADIQSDLFYDYRTNVDAYPTWQAWMREKQPRLLVLWGKYDLSFELSEPEAYRRDVPKAEVHILDAGHFALDTAADQIAQLVRGFMTP